MHDNTIIFTRVAMVMALGCAVRAALPSTDQSCSTRTDCAQCTAATRSGARRGGGTVDGGSCWWSTERQTCSEATSAFARAATVPRPVRDPADCPRVVVVGDRRAVLHEPYAYRVNVSNDAAAGLVSYLSRVGFACLTDGGGRLGGRVLRRAGPDGGGEIACDPVARTRLFSVDRGRPAMGVGHFYVQFGPYNATLRLDRDEDYYVAFYDRDCAAVGGRGDRGYDDGCVDCAWTAGDYRYYVKRCSSRNQCVGSFKYYDTRKVKGASKYISGWSNGAHVKCERAITIESFEPAEAPWTATAVKVTVAVRNHRILAEGATVTVTVAGRACTDAQTSPEDEDALTCTVSAGPPAAAAAAVGAAGPVRVAYEARGRLTVESAAKFRFVAPAVTGLAGPSCGPAGGGTALTVVGAGFNASRTVRVFVQWADGTAVPCRVARAGYDFIRCSTTAGGRAPTGRGRVRADFDGPVSLFAPGRGFAYVDTPRPADDGRRLAGIASGGTSVTVRWDELECLRDGGTVTFYVYPHHTRSACWPRDDALVCQSPALEDLVGRDAVPEDGPDGMAGLRGGSPIALLECGFDVRYAGDTVYQRCPEAGYAVYADPRFVGFEVADGKVVIYGHGELGLGFDESDVSVRFGDPGAGPCQVTWMGRDRVVCAAADARTTAWLVAGGLREVLVSVGHAATVVVPQMRHRGRGAALTGRRTFARFVADNAIATTAAVWAAALLVPIGFIAVQWYRKTRAEASRVAAAAAADGAQQLDGLPA